MSVPEINPTSLILKNFDDGKGEKERKDNEKRKKREKRKEGEVFIFGRTAASIQYTVSRRARQRETCERPEKKILSHWANTNRRPWLLGILVFDESCETSLFQRVKYLLVPGRVYLELF